MPISPPAPERAPRLLTHLQQFTSLQTGQLDAARRLLRQHPSLPLDSFGISSSIYPEPGRPQHNLILRLGAHDTAGITAWARALGTEPRIDGARHRLNTVLDGIGIWASATVPETDYDMDQAVFVPTADDVTETIRGLLVTDYGDDGYLLITGHPPLRDVLAVTSAYYRETCGVRLRAFDGRALADNISRSWGQFVAYPTREEWQLRSVPEDTPGALPVTWMYARDGHTQDIGAPVHCPTCGRPSRGLDYDSETGDRVHLCPAPVCRHRWHVDHCPTSPGLAPDADQRAALTFH
ncbi:hypothetical protein OHB41_49795 [Streptomyces sp. NBC_01571]|uniref:hypothetical protein n=1 Tax=Streptomyces sp. NBC_01571 TaxID=2975883 RepID=UPI00225324DD|nr:hypothetical protein [Streptomyces sp. NBC_01571]MCX4581057.1 hypothetical protein [Streptomyces sp. NBC_01571]